MTALAPCPAHPLMLLPDLPEGWSGRLLCPICAQERRRATYAAQLAEWRRQRPILDPYGLPGPCAMPPATAEHGPRPGLGDSAEPESEPEPTTERNLSHAV